MKSYLNTEQFARLLDSLLTLDQQTVRAASDREAKIRAVQNAEQTDEGRIRSFSSEWTEGTARRTADLQRAFRGKMDQIRSDTIQGNRDAYQKLNRCICAIAEADAVDAQFEGQKFYQSNSEKKAEETVSSDQLTGEQPLPFAARVASVIAAFSAEKKRAAASESGKLGALVRGVRRTAREEIARQRGVLSSVPEAITPLLDAAESQAAQDAQAEWARTAADLDRFRGQLCEQRRQDRAKREADRKTMRQLQSPALKKTERSILQDFPPAEMCRELTGVAAAEPAFDAYTCSDKMPQSSHVGTLKVPFSKLKFSQDTMAFLEKHYPFLLSKNYLLLPVAVQFSRDFNTLFRYDMQTRKQAVADACAIGLQLFMTVPAGKIRFTFIDPLELGASFAMFGQLVDTDDRTSEVINGKIWSDPKDIEDKLHILTNHISNVTQRCLQGKYDNIYQYNQVAEQNAEPYQVLMLMDYPAGLSERSLKLLEQIVASGPKCGVFTVIYRNESQFRKLPEKLHPLISNIETDFTAYNYNAESRTVSCAGIRDQRLSELIRWEPADAPSEQQRADIIPVLKKGLKNADKVEIGIEKVQGADVNNSTKNGIHIPIGVHGANEQQYLTLGTGGSHHALIAGVAGSGKSSLLHTIIMQTLRQYSPDEVSIYLVDFKRGVEFKIYADFVLPAFRVVAIESEREFGYNILEALEREQKIRADLFKRAHVDKIEEYRTETGKPMPRILVIMDEFQELFSGDNDDFSRKSAMMLERIVRQGRAFGVHLILSSQSYSNIRGVDRSVYDQMAVRIVLKCSNADADLLLENGSSEVDQISIDDPGRAVYNSEAGNKEYNSHFRVAYIKPEKHKDLLGEVSRETASFADDRHQTRILLSNIEDNRYSFFNRFIAGETDEHTAEGKLYLGEPLSIANDMDICFTRSEYSNLLMLGSDTDKARSMAAFALLSLCADYYACHGAAPAKPLIRFFNCKPLHDSYFKDIPKLIAERLPAYIQYISAEDESKVQNVLQEYYEAVQDKSAAPEQDSYFFVFGYQRADVLKSEIKLSQSDDIDMMFNLGNAQSRASAAPKDMFRSITEKGALRGIHVLMWQDSYQVLEQDDKDIMSYFTMKTAFSMSPDEFSRSVGENDVSLMGENNAIYYNRARDNQKFRPYQMPDEGWVTKICDRLNGIG